MSQLNIGLAVVGFVVVAIGLVSNQIKRSPVQEPMVAMLAGIAVGPYALGWLDLATWGDEKHILEQAARLTLAVGLMAVALRIKRESLTALWRPVTVLLTAGMFGMWLVSAALCGWILGLSLWTALLIGAVVTPTDPVVASSIVTGPFAKKHLPLRLRDAISLESGANDGLAYAFVILPVFMLSHPSSGWSRWLVDGLLVGVLGAVVIGCVVGVVAARLLHVANCRGMIESPSLLSYTVAFSLMTLGGARLVGADAIISVFLAGLTFNLVSSQREEEQESRNQETVAKLFTLPIFVLFGLALPIAEWKQIGVPLAAVAVAILLLRRPLIVALLWPGLRPRLAGADVMYIGWFGPIGVAAIYYAFFARSHGMDPLVWHVASAVIFASVLAHGVTAAPLTRLYARRLRAGPEVVKPGENTKPEEA